MSLRIAALAGAGLAALALLSGLLWYRAEAARALADRDRARAALEVAVDANRTLEAALRRAQEQAVINDRILLGLSTELARINAAIAEASAGIAELEKSDEEVRSYLGARVPGALELQLNR